ncbi:MAG TPA: hypothetical protein ENJ95_03920 [Bacteroidetes bacterium]|nr:hypothetical protein [Bacteroidota bacterium]
MFTVKKTRSKSKFYHFRFVLFSATAVLAISWMGSGCNTDDFNDLSEATIKTNGAVAFPIGKVDFTLADLLEDDTLLSVDANGGIRLVHREEDLFALTAEEVMDGVTGGINERFEQSSTIGAVDIDDVSQETDILFSFMLDHFNDLVIADYIEQNDGQMAPVPPFDEMILTETDVPAFTSFTSLNIENGFMSLTVTNDLFFDLLDFSVDIIDTGNGQNIGTFSFDNIAVGETKVSEINLQGKNISNEYRVVMSSIKTPGTGTTNVLIDLDSRLHILFAAREVRVNGGVVALPAGVLAEDELTFELSTDNGEEIKSIHLEDANVAYEFNSDVQADIHVKVTFPDVRRNNVPMVQEFDVSPTATSGPLTGMLDFSNTDWALDKDAGQPFNRVKAVYEVSLPNATAGQVAFSSEDRVDISFVLSDIRASEIVGYFGFRQEILEESELDLGYDFSAFANNSNPLLFSDPQMRIEINNSFGIPLSGEFNATARGQFGGEASLNPPRLEIGYPSLAEAGQSVETILAVNKNNSDIVGLLAVYPELIRYEGTATINPESDPSILNFVNSDSRLTAAAEFDLPFKFRTQGIFYRDTMDAPDLNLDNGDITIDNIDSAHIKISYENGLPLESTLRLIAYDGLGNETLVVEGVKFESAEVNGQGRVTGTGVASGELVVPLTSQQLHFLNDALQYIFEIKMQTSDGGQVPVAIYTNYRVEMGFGIFMAYTKK